MKIPPEEHQRLKLTLEQLRTTRLPFWRLWRELADYFLPKRYVWLQSDTEQRTRNAKNPYILDGTGTRAARVLASGMMNGITSPGRPWFELRIPGYDDDGGEVTQWCDEVTSRMMLVMSESNFYNSMAVLYLDLSVFGTAASLIYEDDESVIRCYNPALGEYYFAQSDRLAVNTFGREFKQSANQLASWFGEENCSDQVRTAFKTGGAMAQTQYVVYHLVEPNVGPKSKVPSSFPFRETYWEGAAPTPGTVLRQRGFHELPGIFPRWEVSANDDYGTSPCMDALPDVIQLQQETKRKAQGLDKVVNPPIIADIQLQHRPTALLPNGVTYVAGNNSIGAKPLYQITPPIDAMTSDIRDIRQRIQETLHNDLFNMISQLETVRSATEIDARKEEKLVLLGPVLERFESEALNPGITRIFAIMSRGKLIPPPPKALPPGTQIKIQYVSILSVAQRAVAAAPTERWIGVIGNIAGAVPEVLKVPNWTDLVRNYGLAIGVEAKNMHTKEQIQAAQEAELQQKQLEAQAQQAQAAVAGAKQLSETDVGGGANALQTVLGGAP